MTVELPKDAKGRKIPLDTEVLYDKEGKRREVDWYTFYPDKDRWDVVFEDSCVRFSPRNLSLTKPDSWEKLLDDLDKAASKTYCGTCTYFGKNPTDCDTCAIGDISACDSAAMRDIASRIRKLRGEE